MPPLLTKSKFVAGLQCHKLLYWKEHDKKAPELVPDLSLQHRFREGTEVGERARTFFPGGVLVDARPWEREKAVQATLDAMDSGAPAIFEAAFEASFDYGAIHVRVDILERAGEDSWRIVEVKSTTKLKDEHIPDLAVQWHVLEKCGVSPVGADLMHLNRKCRHPDLSTLFTRTECTDRVKEFLPSVGPEAAGMAAILPLADLPEVEIGDHCSTPYECPFLGRCWPAPIPHAITELYRARRPLLDRLAAAGAATIVEITDDVPLNDIQERQRMALLHGAPVVTDALDEHLAGLEYPLHYLDFESVSPAIPRYPGTRPYDPTVFQLSCHTREEDGSRKHHELLSEKDDPRREMAECLIEILGDRGTIVSYSTFEEQRIKDLAKAIPEKQEELLGLIPRIWDLLKVVRQGIYHPDFHGSFSIKATYPALCPGSGYGDLEIAEGTIASIFYEELMGPGTSEERKAKIRKDLLAYCRRDTEAMVQLHQALEKMVGGDHSSFAE